jgi:hypothetical protein
MTHQRARECRSGGKAWERNDMKSVYRVHVVMTYPEGHVFKTRQGDKIAGIAGKDHNVTMWEIVLATGCEEAMRAVRDKWAGTGADVKRIYSLNHIGDITVVGD